MRARRSLRLFLVLCVANFTTAALAQSPPSPRTDRFGDALPNGALVRLGTIRLRATASAVAFAPDGKTILTAIGVAGMARWDAASGRLRDEIALPGAPEMSSWFSPDGRLLAVVEVEAISIWDTASGKRVHRLTGRPAVGPVAFGGNLVAVGEPTGNGQGHVRLWDLATGKNRFFLVATEFYALALTFDRAGKRLFAALGDQSVSCWDVATGKALWRQKHFAGHITLSPDGAVLAATTYGGRGPLAIWDAATGKRIATLGTKEMQASQLALSPDGRTLAHATGTKDVLLWDIAGRKVRERIAVDDPYLAFAPAGRSIVTAGKLLQRWDVATAKALFADTRDRGHAGAVDAVTFAPDGRSLASSGADGTVRVWDLADGRFRELRSDAPPAGRLWDPITDSGIPLRAAVPLEFTLDGRYLLSDVRGEAVGFAQLRGGTLVLTNVQTGKEARRFRLPQPEGATTSTVAARLTADGKQVRVVGQTVMLFAAADFARPFPEPVRGWALDDGSAALATNIPLRKVDTAAFAPSCSVVAVASTHKLHDLHTGMEWSLDAAPNSIGMPVAFSGDGRLVAAAEPGLPAGPTRAIQVFEVLTGRRVARIATDLGRTTVLGFSGDGRLLAGAGDSALHVWDSASGKRVLHLDAKGRLTQWHAAGFATSLDFSPGGKALATGHADGTIHLWDIAPAWQAFATPRPKIDPAACWTDLAADAAVAHVAMARLASAPAVTLPALKQRMHAVRIDSAWLAARIRDLDDDDFDTRQAGMRDLTRVADAVETALRQAMAKPASLEARRRIEQLLASLKQAKPSSEMLRQLRAIAVPERIGSAPAEALLRQLADGAPDARLTREARAVLARMQRHAAAAR